MNFRFDLGELKPADWMRLGEATAKIQWILSAVLQPGIAEQLLRVYLVKGIQATTAIEGNTLDEDEVHRLVDGKLQLPPGRRYLAQEVQNVLDACNGIVREVQESGTGKLSTEAICNYNA